MIEHNRELVTEPVKSKARLVMVLSKTGIVGSNSARSMAEVRFFLCFAVLSCPIPRPGESYQNV